MSLLLLFNPTEAGPTSVTLAPATITLTAQPLASAVAISGNLLSLLRQDFEDNGHGYTAENDSSLSRTSLSAADGRFALRLQKGSTSTYLDMYAQIPTVTGVSGSTSYTASFQRKAETTSRQTQIVVAEYDISNVLLNTQSSALEDDYTTTWSVQTFTFTTDPATAKLSIALFVTGTPASNEAHYFDYVALRTDPNPPLPPDAYTKTLNPATITLTARPLTFSYGTVTKALSPVTVTVTARPLKNAVRILGNLYSLDQQDFEAGTASYAAIGNLTLSASTDFAVSGGQSLKLTKTVSTDDMAAQAPTIPVSNLTQYTISGQWLAGTVTRQVGIYYEEYTVADVFVAAHSSALQNDQVGVFDDQAETFTTNILTAKLAVFFYVYNVPSGESHYLDYVAVRTDPNPPIPPGGNIEILTPVTLTLTARSLTFSYGTISKTLSPATLTVTARPFTFTYGTANKVLSPPTVTVTARPLTFTYGAASKSLSPILVTLTGRPLTVSYGTLTRTLAPATITLTVTPLSFVYGPADFTLTPVTVSFIPRPLTYTAAPYTFAFLGSTISLTPVAPNFVITGGPTSFDLHTTTIQYQPRPATFAKGTKTFGFVRSQIQYVPVAVRFRIPGILTQPIYLIFTGGTEVSFETDTLQLQLQNEHWTLDLEGETV